MFRNRIVISSLHEDLMNIGLLPKTNQKFLNEMVDEEMVDEAGDEEGAPWMHKKPEDPDMDGDDDSTPEGDTDDDQGQGEDGEENPEGEEGGEETPETPDEDLDGHDDTNQYNDGDEESDKDHQAEMDIPAEKPHAPFLSHQKLESNTVKRVGALLENVNSLVNGVHSVQRKDALKSFANISMISEMLSRGFIRLAKALDEQDLRGVASTYRTLSEDAGKVALVLKTKNVSKLDERFKGNMNILLQGLDLYEDILEACEDPDHDDKPEHDHDDDGDIDIHVDKVGHDHPVDDDDDSDKHWSGYEDSKKKSLK